MGEAFIVGFVNDFVPWQHCQGYSLNLDLLASQLGADASDTLLLEPKQNRGLGGGFCRTIRERLRSISIFIGLFRHVMCCN